jgi:hypothetical protein
MNATALLSVLRTRRPDQSAYDRIAIEQIKTVHQGTRGNAISGIFAAFLVALVATVGSRQSLALLAPWL